MEALFLPICLELIPFINFCSALNSVVIYLNLLNIGTIYCTDLLYLGEEG